MSIVAQSLSHRGEITELCGSAKLCMILLRSVRSRYHQRSSEATVLFRHSQPLAILPRFYYALGVLANFRPDSNAFLKLCYSFRFQANSSNISGFILV